MSFPLNINLIIPFKDNKGDRLKLYLADIKVFKVQLELRVEDLKNDLDEIFGTTFELTISARSDGSVKKYYWRFKSSKQDRKYNRLRAESVLKYLATVDETRRFRVKEVESELLFRVKEVESELLDINANMKLLKGMVDSIELSMKEKQLLRQINFRNIEID
jgi:hypothetical protein